MVGDRKGRGEVGRAGQGKADVKGGEGEEDTDGWVEMKR